MPDWYWWSLPAAIVRAIVSAGRDIIGRPWFIIGALGAWLSFYLIEKMTS